MSVQFRTYQNDNRFGADYNKVRDFLLRLDDCNYPFGRWDWMITHSMLNPGDLTKIGLWEDDSQLVALATFDLRPYQAHLLVCSGYEHLYDDMIVYSGKHFTEDGVSKICVRDGNLAFQDAAAHMGFIPTQSKECDAVYPIDLDTISYTLPEGFTITDMAETYDLYKYGQVLWKGFNHEIKGEGSFMLRQEELPEWELGFKRPNLNPQLKVAVAAPNGDFVSYCGMWYDPACENALVEPVATDPAYRKMGLGRAAVLEAVRRCGKLGAKRAFVGSSQQFYYSIGFRPYATSTFWEKKEK
jgi:GNAT superfamily N-acetyltransferase